MKITLVSPTFPPDHCGVGDHSARLKSAIEKLGHEVSLCKTLSEVEKSDAIIVQYTPYLWSSSRLRLNPLLASELRKARKRAGAPVALLAHEVHYPVGWSPQGVLLGWGQKLQFLALARRSDRVLFTYRAARNAFEAIETKTGVLPVGSNIPPTAEEKSGTSPLLLHFGGNHPTHCLDWTIDALEAARATNPGVQMVWVGVATTDRDHLLARIGKSHLAGSIQALGYLSSEDVSKWISRSTLVLAPFLDGVSTRRGSAMAAFEHARPVVTTLGWASDPTISWKNFCFVSEPNSNDFSKLVCTALKDPRALEQKAGLGRETYLREFSWERIASRLLGELKGNA